MGRGHRVVAPVRCVVGARACVVLCVTRYVVAYRCTLGGLVVYHRVITRGQEVPANPPRRTQ